MSLLVRRYFRRFLAVGQKLEQKVGEDSSFGQGFNYHLEVSFPVAVERSACLKALKEVVATVDHKALGVDVRLDFLPTTENLAKYIRDEVQKHLSANVTVRLERGDGFVVEEFS